MFKPETKTDAVKPSGRLIDGASFGLKKAVLFIQSGAVEGFDTICAVAIAGRIRRHPVANHTYKNFRYLSFIARVPPHLADRKADI
jgi:hypothetical protein